MKRVAKTIVSLLCLAALGIAVFAVIVPALLGMQRYVITGGSMTGTIPKGSVVYAKLVPVDDLKAGDIITFVPPGFSTAVTHRIIGVEPAPDGRPVFRTKGDYNAAADPWEITLDQPTQARYSFHIPVVGYVLAAMAIRQVRMIVIGLPALVIALSLLWSLWRQAGDEVRQQEAEL